MFRNLLKFTNNKTPFNIATNMKFQSLKLYPLIMPTLYKTYECSYGRKLVHNTTFHRNEADRAYVKQMPKSENEVVNVVYITKSGDEKKVKGKIGDNVMYLAIEAGLEVEGACEGSLACTTCHMYVDESKLNILPPIVETEEDLLDSAPFLKTNSRLTCQIYLAKELEGIKLKLPLATRNFYVDDFKPHHK